MPGPVDGLPPATVARPPAISRTRLLVTAGAVVAGLVFVVAVGAGVRRADAATAAARRRGVPAFNLPLWDGDVDEPPIRR